MTIIIIALMGQLIGSPPELTSQPASQKFIVPLVLIDIDGKRVDVEQLAKNKKLFFITLKATWCPVCQNQLLRLKKILPKLRLGDATFVVLSPGPRKALQAVKAKTGFPFPFVEDAGLRLAKHLNLVLMPGQMKPVIFAVNKKREIIWVQAGRSGRYYGDKELQEYLDCDFEIASLE